MKGGLQASPTIILRHAGFQMVVSQLRMRYTTTTMMMMIMIVLISLDNMMMASWDPELRRRILDPDLRQRIPTNFSITISGQEV